MSEGDAFRRRWRVSFLRLALALGVIAVAAWTFCVGSTAEMERMQDPHVLTFGRALAIVAVAPLLWLIPLGALADHFLSGLGALGVLVLHLIGIHVAVFLVAISVGPFALLNGPLLASHMRRWGWRASPCGSSRDLS